MRAFHFDIITLNTCHTLHIAEPNERQQINPYNKYKLENCHRDQFGGGGRKTDIGYPQMKKNEIFRKHRADWLM